MKVTGLGNKILQSKSIKKAIELASDNPTLFAAGTTFALSAAVRPAVIMATPKTNKEDKKYAILKSFSSGLTGLLLSFGITKPIESAIKKIDKNPENYLTD